MKRNKAIRLYALLALTAGLSAGPATFASSAAADEAFPQKAPRFVRIGPEHGLSNKSATALAQDHQGFLWIGTHEGLNRYDGASFRSYYQDLEDPGSLRHNFIGDLLISRDGTLWVVTLGGLHEYLPESDSFRAYPNRMEEWDLPEFNHGYVAYENRQGEILFGTYLGLAKVNRKEKIVEPILLPDVDDRGVQGVHSLQEDRRGFLWVGTRTNGLIRIDQRPEAVVGERFRRYLSDPDDPHSLPHNYARRLLEADDGTLWVGTDAGLARYRPESDDFEVVPVDAKISIDPRERIVASSLASPHVNSLAKADHGRLWVGTDGGGLHLYEPASGEVLRIRHHPYDETTLGNDVVRETLIDASGDLWVSCFNGGVAYSSRLAAPFGFVQPNPFDPQSLSRRQVASFFEDDDGTLWVGTDGGGLNRRDPKTGRFEVFRHDPDDPRSLSADAVLSMERDAFGDLWIGTYFGGLSRMRPGVEGFDRFLPDPEAVMSYHIWSIREDREETLWFATFHGIYRRDPLSKEFRHYGGDPGDPDSLVNGFVWSFLEDSSGRLWAATQAGAGFYDRTEDRFQLFRPKAAPRLRQGQILSIAEDRDGKIWFGTDGEGLVSWDPKTGHAEEFHRAEGLPGSVVEATFADEEFLWLMTSGGLARYDLDEKVFRRFDRRDGLSAAPLARNAIFRSRSGLLYLGGANGYSTLAPEKLRLDTKPPPIVLTDFQILRDSSGSGHAEDALDSVNVSLAKKARLRADQSTFKIEWAALSYHASQKNRFAYYLEGLENDWIDAGSRRSALYVDLPPGDYVFRVRGSNSSGTWNEEGASLAIIVRAEPR